MSCWVAPTVAAEYWGVSVEHILARIEDGTLPCRTEQDFVFVDVMPHTPVASPPAVVQAQPKPTFVSADSEAGPDPLSEAEKEALLEGDCPGAEGDETLLDEADDNPLISVEHWTAARRQASLLRRPPQALRRSA